jgi:hypothetical protein
VIGLHRPERMSTMATTHLPTQGGGPRAG